MDTKEKELTCYDLETRLAEAIETMDEDYDIAAKAKRDGLSEEDARTEVLNEIIDGIIPVYNYDLLTVAGSNLWLGEYETEWGSRNAFQLLREAIYMHLQDKAGELLDKKAKQV